MFSALAENIVTTLSRNLRKTRYLSDKVLVGGALERRRLSPVETASHIGLRDLGHAETLNQSEHSERDWGGFA